MTLNVRGYAPHSPANALGPFPFERRDPRPDDAVIEIRFCGVRHFDLHQAQNDWSNSRYPMVPGHEIVWVADVGPEVSRFKPGDTASVEQYCQGHHAMTYTATTAVPPTAAIRNRSWSPDPFALKVPESLDLGRRAVAGAVIGAIRETQDMLDFCGRHGITSDIEVIGIQDINQAYDHMSKSNMKYRFVIDRASLNA